MTKNTAKYLEAMALMLAVVLAPASSAYAQTTGDTTESATPSSTETNTVTADAQSDKADDQKRKDKQREELKRIEKTSKKSDRQDRVAKVRENTDRIRDKATDISGPTGKLADLTYEGKANGYAILGGQAFVSSIGLSGKGHHLNGGNWEITAIGDISVADKNAKLDLRGHVRGNVIALKGTGTLSDGAIIDIHLKGHYAPIQGNEYAIAFTNSHIQYKDNGTRMPLMLVGSATVTPTQPIPEPVIPAQ